MENNELNKETMENVNNTSNVENDNVSLNNQVLNNNDSNEPALNTPSFLNNDTGMPVEEKKIEEPLQEIPSEEPKKEEILNEETFRPETQKKKSNKSLILIIILVIIILVMSFLLYKILVMDKDTKNKDDNNEVTSNVEKYTLNIYKTEDGSYTDSNYNNYEVAFTIETETKTAKVLDSENSFILYKDNEIKIYDIENQKIKEITIDEDYDYYTLVANDKKVIGIISNSYGETRKSEYYNLEKNQKMYTNYTNIQCINDKYITGYIDGKIVLLSAFEEKEVNDFIDNLLPTTGYSNLEIKYNNKSFYVLQFNGEADLPIIIYDNNKKIITSHINGEYGYDIVDNYLYVSSDDAVKKYNIDGELITTIDDIKDENVEMIINNYVAYIANNSLNLMNIDTKESMKIADWVNSSYIDEYTSGYYDRTSLDKRGEKDKEEGIYLVVYYKDKDENGNYGMEYCYTKDKEVKVYPIKNPMDGRAKPVLYLYPTKKTNIKVEFQYPSYLTTTYPKYINSWNVTAYPNGDLYDKDDKYYYALYWDEVRYHEVDFQEGFYVTKDNAINFLEEKLDIIGLNKKEKNEFIMYWLPILENNKKSLVYFELTDEREAYNKLLITPKPDSLLRVSIHIKKVDKEIKIKEQQLETFERKGFTAIEWGGMTY